MRFLILAHSGDDTALRVEAILKARHGPDEVRLVLDQELSNVPYLSHRLDGGQVITEMRLSDSTEINSANIGVVFNRLLIPTVPYFASLIDQDYAAMEMYALCLSWLKSLHCPVVNKVTPTNLGNQPLSQVEWLWLAGKVGLPVRGFHFSSDPRWFREKTFTAYRSAPGCKDFVFEKILTPPATREPTFYLEDVSEQKENMLVINSYLIGKLGSLYGEQLKHLARVTECDLLQVMFARTGATKENSSERRNWKVVGVTSIPEVQTTPAIFAIVQLLESKLIKTE